jgi:hypothetical protein
MVFMTCSFLLPVRFAVAVVFAISNAIVASVAVWNLSIVDGSVRFCESLGWAFRLTLTEALCCFVASTATVAAGYLIVVATMGLLLVFPV